MSGQILFCYYFFHLLPVIESLKYNGERGRGFSGFIAIFFPAYLSDTLSGSLYVDFFWVFQFITYIHTYPLHIIWRVLELSLYLQGFVLLSEQFHRCYFISPLLPDGEQEGPVMEGLSAIAVICTEPVFPVLHQSGLCSQIDLMWLLKLITF